MEDRSVNARYADGNDATVKIPVDDPAELMILFAKMALILFRNCLFT
jgi:hypothetical protein